MFRKNSVRIAAVGIIAAALIGASVSVAHAADEPVPTVGSKGKYFIGDASNGDVYPAGTQFNFDDAYIGMVSDLPADIEATFNGTNDSTMVKSFIAPRGSERTPSAWVAWADGGFMPGTKNVLYPSANLSGQISGNQSTVRAGGNFSLGLAFMNNNGLNISADDVYYTYITVLPNGKWTAAYPSSTTPEEPSANSFDVNLEATTMAAPDGPLSLSAPSVTTAAIGNPAMVDGLSTSTGTLGEFTVTDERYTSHPGWTLTTTVTQFTNSADTSKVIAASQLGVAPKLVDANPNVTVSAPQVAGSASYPSLFAQSNATAASGAVKMNADLKFVSPSNMPAGTYTSKLTLTLASK